MKTYVRLWKNLAEFFSEWGLLQTEVVQKTKSHIFCSITSSKNRAIYETMWKNMVQPDKPQMEI